MKLFLTTALASLMLLGTGMSAEAARPFGHTAKLPRAPKNFTPPAKFIENINPDLNMRRARPGVFMSTVDNSAVAANPAAMQHIKKVNAGGTNLFGYLNYNRSGLKQGWYEFTRDNGLSMLWSDPLFTYENGYDELITSWVKGDKLCGYCDWYAYGYFWGQTYYELELSTGVVVTEEQDEDCIYDGGVFISACYDPEENVVYGYSTDDWDADEVTTANFQRTTAYPWGYDVVKELGSRNYSKACKSIAYNPVDKGLYGITLENNFVKIDKATGDQTVIAKLDTDALDYVTGMCYSTAEGLFYWNPAYDDTNSAIVTINPVSGAIKVVDAFTEGGESFGCLAEIGSTITSDSPLRPEIVSDDFAAGATSGSITIKMPSSYADGRPLTKQVAWYAKVDGRSYSNGTAAAGAEVKVEYTNLTAASHDFSYYCEVDGSASAEITTTLYIGSDTPAAPESVTLEKDNIHWTSVKTGINGGYIDPAAITYEVYLDGVLLAKTGRTSVKENVGEGAPFARHQAYVRAVYDNQRSAATYSNYLNAGEAWELPVDMVASQAMFDLCTTFTLDGETDEENVWQVDPYRDANAFYAGQADYVEGNDWLILPAINFPDADVYYSLYVTAMSVAAKYDSRMEVCIGEYPDPTSMDTVIIPEFQPQSRDYATYSQLFFKVPFEGEYYIGIHAKTGKNSCGVMVHEVRVENDNLVPTSPAAVTDLTATAGANGALEAVVSFTLPTKDLSGKDLAADADINVKVVAANTVELTGKPGQAMTATVKTVQGDNRITVTLRQGELNGESSIIDLYTGVTVPGTIKNMEATVHADMMGVDFTWETPDPDKKGGYVDPATVEYYLIIGTDEGVGEPTHIGNGLTSYTLNLPAGTEQNYYRVGIEARNVAGTTGRYMAITTLLGTPYKLPLKEDFEGEYFSCGPWIVYSDNDDVSWFTYEIKNITTEWKDMEGTAICAVGTTDATNNSTLGIPRFSTKGVDKVTVKFLAWTGEQSADVKILGSVYTSTTPEQLVAFPYTNSDADAMWKTVEFTLPAKYTNCDWVQLYIDAYFGVDRNYVIIDSIEITGEDSSVIGVMNANGSIMAGNGAIIISGYAGEQVAVYSLDGRTVANTVSNGDCIIAVEPGIYVVKAGQRSVKIAVR